MSNKKNPSLWQRALEAATGEEGATGSALANRILAKMPGGAIVQEQLGKAEKRVLGELKARLDRLEGEQSTTVQLVAFSMESIDKTHAPTRDLRGPGETLRQLLQASSDAVLNANYILASLQDIMSPAFPGPCRRSFSAASASSRRPIKISSATSSASSSAQTLPMEPVAPTTAAVAWWSGTGISGLTACRWHRGRIG